ncbi:MAG: hypothetical protein ABJL99_00180 [Aliishimia sp.]
MMMIDLITCNAVQHSCQPSLRIAIVEFGCLDKSVCNGSGFTPSLCNRARDAFAITKQTVKARIAVSMHPTLIVGQVIGGVFAARYVYAARLAYFGCLDLVLLV